MLFASVWVRRDWDSAPTLLSQPFDSFHFWWRSHWNDPLFSFGFMIQVVPARVRLRVRLDDEAIMPSCRGGGNKIYYGNFARRRLFSSLSRSRWTQTRTRIAEIFWIVMLMFVRRGKGINDVNFSVDAQQCFRCWWTCAWGWGGCQ